MAGAIPSASPSVRSAQISGKLARQKLPPDRVHQVMKWIISGASEYEIQEAAEKEWPDARSKPLIVAAMQRIAKSADADPDLVKAWAIEAAKDILKKASVVADHATALRAIRQITDLALNVTSAAAATPSGCDDAATKELDRIRSYLSPLKLSPSASADTVSVSELARLAVQRIVELTSAKA